MKTITTILLAVVFQSAVVAQQVADSAYNPAIQHPEYSTGKGPVIVIDEGHNNFHTRDGRYMPFARLLERDGYVVAGYEGEFDGKQLAGGRILVIANALNEINTRGWYLPTPSAFTAAEIETVRIWVKAGGSLFLIADHMPFAGAAAELAAAFGFRSSNGFAFDTITQGPSFFSLNEGTLKENSITRGRDTSEAVNTVVTFTGQAFTIPAEATPILTFGPNWMSFEPDTAWVFNDKTRRIPVKGWSQGAFMKYGQGRIAVFGEAAMFSAQLAGPDRIPAGMNAPYAPENYKLLLNIVHWLDGKID
jgi:hypothetical protein